MKKTLLLSVATILASVSFGQMTIEVEGISTDISGQIHDEVVASGSSDYHVVNFIVTNNTGSAQSWIVTRRNMTEPAGWGNYYCWGQTGVIGNCYAASSNEFFNSNAESIPDGSSGTLSTYVSTTSGEVSQYRYYVSTDGQNFVDSVDLRINYVAAVEPISPILEVSIAPNPATDYIKVTAGGVESASVKIMDVLGNVIMKTTIAESKTIDVSEYRNGIYFVIVESQGQKTISRKVFVRH